VVFTTAAKSGSKATEARPPARAALPKSSNSVIRLSPQLAELDFFAPRNWAELNAADLDLGSVGPALLDNDLAFQIGKEGVGFLLQRSNLGGIGGEVFAAAVCAGAGAYGGTAHTATTIYVPCTNGLFALEVEAGPSFRLAWASASFFAGPPIISGGAVWTISRAGVLFALNALTGDVVFQTTLPGVTNFASPASDGGRIFAPAGLRIAAFALTP
jgi:outer membrane protein assembly factor BamB